MITRNFILHLTAGLASPLVINVNQYDQGEQWLFTLYNQDGTQYVPSSGAIVGIKSDNLGIINSGTVDSQGRVVINETQQMTAAVGKAVFELVIDDGTHGTANFVVLVEEKPGNNADLSETDISMIEEAIEAASTIKPYGSPLVASTVAGMTDHEKVYVYVGSETGYTSGNWYYWDGSAWTSGGVYNSVAVQTDTTLTLSGVAADAKKTGDEISDLKSQITNGVPPAVKLAIDNILQNVSFKNDILASSDLATIHTWATSATLTSISAVYTQSGTVYDTDSLDSLKDDLVVTALYDNETSSVVTDYTLSGTLAVGTSTITVSYGGKTTSFNVTVDASPYLYVLSSPFASTGTEKIDTELLWEKSTTYTVLCDFIRTGTTSSTSFVYSSKKAGNATNYIGLQTQNTRLWGMGVGYNAGANLTPASKRIRTAVVVVIGADGSASASMNYKNVTDSGTVQTMSNTYSADMTDSTKSNNIALGDAEGEGTGFVGTVNHFAIYEGEMSSADIASYLENGAS